MVKNYIFFHSHPIQYFTPLYKNLTSSDELKIEVWYGSKHGLLNSYDKEFNTSFKWDVDLLEGYKHVFLKNLSFKPGPYGFFGLINMSIIKMLWNQEKSTIIIHGWNYFSNWLIIVFAKLFGHRMGIKAETPCSHEKKRAGILYTISRIALKAFVFSRIDEVHYIGSQNKLFFEKMGVPLSKMIHTPYSVDNDKFRMASNKFSTNIEALKVELGIPLYKKLFLFSGKYIQKKNPLDLLNAISLLSKYEQSESHFIFMGDGYLRDVMEEVINKNKLSNVTLTGFVNQSSVSKYYALSDVFIMCSGLGETWGLSTNEAMCFGLPVILSDLVGSSYDLVEENGLVFETGNYLELKKCIEVFLEMKEESYYKMRERSLAHIKEYSYDKIAQNIKNHNWNVQN